MNSKEQQNKITDREQSAAEELSSGGFAAPSEPVCGAENMPATADVRPETEVLSAAEGAEDGASAGGQMNNVQPPKKKHRWVLNLLLIAVIALGLYSLFGISGEITEGEGMSFAEAMNSVSLSGALILLAVIVGIMIVDCLKFCVVNSAVIGRVRPVVAIKTSFLPFQRADSRCRFTI